MRKTILTGVCAAAFAVATIGAASAQTNQGAGSSNSGPASPPAQSEMNKPGTTGMSKSEMDKMEKDKMSKDGMSKDKMSK